MQLPKFYQKGFTPHLLKREKEGFFLKLFKKGGGFTLTETMVGVAIFLIVALSIWQAYLTIMEAVRLARLKITVTALANEQFEIIRNLSYEDVGLIGGLPVGVIEHNQILNRDGTNFLVTTTIRSIDDLFDGTIGGSPNDLSPADYKLAELEISCSSCRNFQPLRFTTQVAPHDLETATTNGAIFIQVFDSQGQPVQGANVHIENNNIIPAISIDETTNNDGILQIVDAPPGAETYEIIVSKPGYSTEQTYAIGDPANPNPIKPHATVAIQQLTEISFSIDKTSVISSLSLTETCSPVPNIDFSIQGIKLIGTEPDVLKYSGDFITDDSGEKIISDLEWDAYNFSFTDDFYDLAGTIPLLPLTLNPETNQDFKIVVAEKDPRSLLLTVKDAATQLPLSGAEVHLEKTGFDSTLVTGQGFLRQTNWSGGAGQEDFIDQTKYYDSDGNIEISDPEGEIHLKNEFGLYAESGYLISSTFDTGSQSNFHQIMWQPLSQPVESGLNSVRFQIATNQNKAIWNFLGPDGTSGTFYALTSQNVNSIHNGDRYIRYKIFLQTEDASFTPNIGDVDITFTSLCVPPGQVFFTGLDSGTYNITISKPNYQEFTDSIDILIDWQQREVILIPA